ncbi:MAG: hypothetical protein A2776_00385 [Candidatus Levybacteria bacterium RIFCSPHIGHO2_01_FULL_40_10]|nr:MAG: hypothetical protein A2776_00385 [Candidatus Levybacteria bacterium RIFCSPHIGHO2_01_FULL_40_10]
MLHEGSDFNVVENNTVEGNTNGIALWHSSSNILRNNIVRNNKHGIRATAQSNDNFISNNKVSENQLYGIYLYQGADRNVIQENTLFSNDSAFYVKTKENVISRNTLEDNRVGIYFLENASGNSVYENKILYNTAYGIYTKVSPGLANPVAGNTLYRNRKNVVAQKPQALRLTKLTNL